MYLAKIIICLVFDFGRSMHYLKGAREHKPPPNAVLSEILLKKDTHINFIYSVDRIMDFNRAEPTCCRTNFPYLSSGQ